VPAGAREVEVELDYLSPPEEISGLGYGETQNATPHLLIVDWHDLLVYPLGADAREIPVRATLRLPAGWRYDTALAAEKGAGQDGVVAFAPASLYTLIDSPVLAGEIFQTLEIGPPEAPVRLSMAADRSSSLAVSAERLAAYRRVPAEALELFGARHYRSYRWLLALSDAIDHNGLEHHESSDDRGPADMFSDEAELVRQGTLLPHEYVHSWNGKYRRPAGLATQDSNEGWLIWLEADTLIRQLSSGQHSLDDFCRRFHGGRTGPPRVKPYTFDDVVATLDEVAPYDWRTFFNQRLYSTGSQAPLGGIERGGWRLTYDAKQGQRIADLEAARKQLELGYSLGLRLNTDGLISDVIPGMPAAGAKLGPGMTVVAVNGRQFSPDVLHDALTAAKTEKEPIRLLISNEGALINAPIDYHGGEQYPHLVRDGAKADLLGQTIAPLTSSR
jgi:predicted metalloprotease with PDZ domain